MFTQDRGMVLHHVCTPSLELRCQMLPLDFSRIKIILPSFSAATMTRRGLTDEDINELLDDSDEYSSASDKYPDDDSEHDDIEDDLIDLETLHPVAHSPCLAPPLPTLAPRAPTPPTVARTPPTDARTPPTAALTPSCSSSPLIQLSPRMTRSTLASLRRDFSFRGREELQERQAVTASIQAQPSTSGLPRARRRRPPSPTSNYGSSTDEEESVEDPPPILDLPAIPDLPAVPPVLPAVPAVPAVPVVPAAALSPTELRSRKRRRGLLQPAVGTPIRVINEDTMKGTDHPKTIWHKEPNPALPALIECYLVDGHPNILTTATATTPADYLGLYFDDTMYAKICVHTNEKIDILRAKYSNVDAYALRHVDIMEMKALIGILIMTGVKRDNHLRTSEMWDKVEGCPLYRCTMPERRFAFLIRCLRLDDAATRLERVKDDRLAPIRALWEALVVHCKEHYTPGPHLTVDEQLMAFRGRCSFRMYIPNKPAK